MRGRDGRGDPAGLRTPHGRRLPRGASIARGGAERGADAHRAVRSPSFRQPRPRDVPWSTPRGIRRLAAALAGGRGCRRASRSDRVCPPRPSRSGRRSGSGTRAVRDGGRGVCADLGARLLWSITAGETIELAFGERAGRVLALAGWQDWLRPGNRRLRGMRRAASPG